MTTTPPPKPLRGFAAMKARDPEAFREIASKAGKAFAAKATRFNFQDPEIQRRAAHKGGQVKSRMAKERRGDA